jgi:hypothetical protein
VQDVLFMVSTDIRKPREVRAAMLAAAVQTRCILIQTGVP